MKLFKKIKDNSVGRLSAFVKFGEASVETLEHDLMYNKYAAFRACPASIKARPDGKTAVINNETEFQCIWIAAPSPINPMSPALPKNLDANALDSVLETMKLSNAQITLTQRLIKRTALQESNAVDKTLDEIDQSKEAQVQTKGNYSRRLDYASEDIEMFSRAAYDGDHRIFRHSLLARIDAPTASEVQSVATSLTMKLESMNILKEVAYGGHVQSLKFGLPTPEHIEETFTDVQGITAASLWPARNPIKLLSNRGLLLGFHADAKTPIYADFESDDFMSKHFALFGGSGTGKSTFQMYLDYNAAATNMDFIHFVPKEDMGTSHLRAIEAIGGQLIKIGDGYANFNPLMVMYDPSTMGDDNVFRKYAFRRTQTSLKKFFEFLIGNNFSTPMKSALIVTLKEAYIRKELITKKGVPINIEKWPIGKYWPNLKDWRKVCEDWLLDERYKSKWASLQALLDNTTELEDGCNWEWMVNNNTFNPSSRFITIDTSGMEEGVKEAVTILLIDIINLRLKTPSLEAYKRKRRTLITLDEGANLLQNPSMAKYIAKLFREARAGKCSICFDNQDLEGAASILPILKANTDFMIFMCNMSSENIDEFSNVFHFSEKDKTRLMQKGKGKYLLLRLGTKIPGDVVLTNKMRQIFFGETGLESNAGESFSGNYEIDPRVSWIRNDGFISSEWITKLDDYEIPGFTPQEATRVMGGAGKLPVWITDSLITESGLIDGESEDHWKTNNLIAGELCLGNCTDVKINHWGGRDVEDMPDVTCKTPSGETLWIEYEHPGSHSKSQISAKKQKQEPFCDIWVCVCQKDNYQQIKATVGTSFCVMRGAGFKKFLEKHGIKKQSSFEGSIEQSKAQSSPDSEDTSSIGGIYESCPAECDPI